MASAFARGLLVGVLVAAPVGPMALLAVRRSLERGFPEGVASGFGIATADAAYAALAAFGLAAVGRVLLHAGRPIQALGGFAVIVLGVRGLFAGNGGEAPRARGAAGLPGAYVSALLLTLGNPPTILTFAALLAAIGAAASGAAVAGALVAGVFAGSALWWILLTAAAARAGRALSPRLRLLIGRAAAALLAALGLVLLLRAFTG